MEEKNNPNQWSQPDPGGNEPDPFSPPTANFAHYLFEYSFPESLMEEAATPSPGQKPVALELPHLPDSVLAMLPDFLKKVVSGSSSNEERDLLLLGALVSLSACLPKMHGFYDGHTVYPNLYLYVADQSSESKDRLLLCKRLVLPVNNAITE